MNVEPTNNNIKEFFDRVTREQLFSQRFIIHADTGWNKTSTVPLLKAFYLLVFYKLDLLLQFWRLLGENVQVAEISMFSALVPPFSSYFYIYWDLSSIF